MKQSQDKKDPNLKFKPILSKRNYEMTQKYPDNFLKRLEYYELFKKRNIENIRNRLFIDNFNKLNNMRFEPKIYYNQYQNIQSKVYDYNIIEKKNRFKKDQTYLEDKKVIEEDMNYQEKNRTSKNNVDRFYNTYNEPRNIMINTDEIADNLLMGYKNDDIWPKELYHKYLDSQLYE